MLIQQEHLTYCTNIHAGESWEVHFDALKRFVPAIKEMVAPDKRMALGLRLSNQASEELIKPNQLAAFKAWLNEAGLYVFTMNGFPYGAFHQTQVKDLVHQPDWTTGERLDYTKRLFDILQQLLPEHMSGGVSTSPLSYRHWHVGSKKEEVRLYATRQIIALVKHLIQIRERSGKLLHLDIEPEPDGLLESGEEFLAWYLQDLLPLGIAVLGHDLGWTARTTAEVIKEHVRLCYDVCHFALGYEEHEEMVNKLNTYQIRIGKIQISAALKGNMPAESLARREWVGAWGAFNEDTYLHQVIAKTKADTRIRYRDLPEALQDIDNPAVTEWRAHYHVPIFAANYGRLESTQEDIKTILRLQRENLLTDHLEVETYTWEVLPSALKQPIVTSIAREMNWVKNQLT